MPPRKTTRATGPKAGKPAAGGKKASSSKKVKPSAGGKKASSSKKVKPSAVRKKVSSSKKVKPLAGGKKVSSSKKVKPLAVGKKVSSSTKGKPSAGGKKVSSSKKVKPSAGGKKPRRTREAVLKELLARKRKDLLRETQTEISSYIKGENRQLVETALDSGDWSVVDLSEDINLRKISNNRDTLIKIDEAIRKLDERTYGICEDCSEEINPERLKVLPFAIRCRDCQEIREEMEAAEKEERKFL
jgi:DnaK suppressor protein